MNRAYYTSLREICQYFPTFLNLYPWRNDGGVKWAQMLPLDGLEIESLSPHPLA